MNELKLTMYSVCRLIPDGGVIHGLPFVAMNDLEAKKMVIENLGKDISKILPSDYELRVVGFYYPDRERPVVKACASHCASYPMGDVIAEIVKTPLEVGECNE